MEQNKTLSMSANPFSVWTDLALNTCEMLAASAEVIGHRAGRMAVAGPIPNARDQREFALMGQEKIDAAAESARAMAEFVMTMNCQLGAQAFSQMLTGSAAMISLAASSSVGQSIERQGELVRTMTESAITASQLPNSAGLLAQSAVEPIYARTKANARRLGKR
jgi:methionine synthase I (cobalamin-dependent)